MNKYKYITLKELLASVKEDFRLYDDMGLIDESRIIKTVMWCNEKLGIPLHQIKETFIDVRDYKAILPSNFWKVRYVCALSTSSFNISTYRDPFNNTVTEEMKCEAKLDSYVEGCTTKCPPIIFKRINNIEVKRYTTWTNLSLSRSSDKFVHKNCMNKGGGKYTIDVEEEEITTPFREGELYMMYLSTMEDEEGNILVPFHPLITSWYEWCIKEKILQDLIFNSDANVAPLLKVAQGEKAKFWLDAWNFTMEPEYRELQRMQIQKEQNFYDNYFKLIL